jgi:hypothetical protein
MVSILTLGGDTVSLYGIVDTRVLLCANMHVPSGEEGVLVLAALLADKNNSSVL